MKRIVIFLVISFLMNACNLLSLMQSTKDIKSSQVPQSAETSQPIQNPNKNQCSEPQAISGTWCSDEQWANIKKCGKFKGRLTFKADGTLVDESGATDGGECSSREETKWSLDCNTVKFKVAEWSDWEGTLVGKTIAGVMSNPNGNKGTWKAVYAESGDCGVIPSPIPTADTGAFTSRDKPCIDAASIPSTAMCYKDIWNNVQKCASAQGKITFKKDGSLTSDITSDDKKCSGSSKGSWRLDCDKLIFTIGKAEFAGTQTESGFSGDVIVGGQKTGTWSAENCGGG